MAHVREQDDDDSIPAFVLVLGRTGVAKSTFFKAVTGLDVQIGDNIHSCTGEVQIYPANAQTFLIDTPGLEDSAHSDTEILQSIGSCLADLREGLLSEGKSIDLSGIVYIHAIDDIRMNGTMMKNLEMFGKIAGERNMQHCALVTSKWGVGDIAAAEQRERELMTSWDYWRRYVELEATIRRFEGTCESAQDIVDHVTKKGKFTPQLTQEYVLEGQPLHKTTVGRAAGAQLEEVRIKSTDELAALRGEHDRALDVHFSETVACIHAMSQEMEAKLKTMEPQIDILHKTREEFQEQIDKADTKEVNYATQVLIRSRQERWRRRSHRAFR